jgi:hypothetical protein
MSSYFTYKLIPPRPAFPADMSDAEGILVEIDLALAQRSGDA